MSDGVLAHEPAEYACYLCEREVNRLHESCPDCASIVFYSGFKPCHVMACADSDIYFPSTFTTPECEL